MRVARWKVMAGGLLLAAGGLVAVADGPCPPPTLSLPAVPVAAAPPPPAAVVAPAPPTLEPPVLVPPPAVQTLPAPPAAPPPLAVTAPKPEVAPASPGPFRPLKGYKLDDGAVIVTPPAAKPVVNPTVNQQLTDMAYTPGAAAEPPPPVVHQKSGMYALTANAEPPAAPAPAVPPADRPERVVAASEPARPEPTPNEKRLKVVLHMGDDRPRFEVRDGDEVYLKVVSDRVEVKSAADKPDAATMKAGGRVSFVTPGGDGTCDELAILPGSGQVVAAGNVHFRHTWGRSETTVSSERMTFRLTHGGPTAIQAGYTPVR